MKREVKKMEKTICPACNTEIEGSVKFCTECGANIEELKKANQRIKDLENSVEGLLTELKKYKQLNGKSKE